jgi:hypothetical protein
MTDVIMDPERSRRRLTDRTRPPCWFLFIWSHNTVACLTVQQSAHNNKE